MMEALVPCLVECDEESCSYHSFHFALVAAPSVFFYAVTIKAWVYVLLHQPT